MAQNAQESILGEGAGRPSLRLLGAKPCDSHGMVDVISVAKRDEHIDVE
jgi:hypothetical protein